MMASTSYTMWYWRSTNNPSMVDHHRSVTQSVELINAAKSNLDDDKVLVMPSIDKTSGEQQTSLEIAIFFPTSYRGRDSFDAARISKMLTRKAKDHCLDYGDFIVQDKEDVRSFSQDELQRIFSAANSSSDWVVTTAQAASADVSTGKASSSFHMARWRVERLRNARGDDIEKEIKSALSTLKSWEDGKSAWSTLIMIASGVAIVSTVLAVYAAIQDASALLALAYVAVVMEFAEVGSMIAAVGPWAALAGIVIGVSVGLGVLVLKGASNVLLVINDTSSQIVRQNHEIANGITKTETPVIESRTNQTTAQGKHTEGYVSVGIYAYSKDETFGTPLSLFGSLIGVSFSLSELRHFPSFSVGMDCPNSIFGGRNSINLLPSDDASGVAGKANDGHDGESRCEIARGMIDVVARRAAETGSINWGVCLVTQEL